jgi:hypothetical protein
MKALLSAVAAAISMIAVLAVLGVATAPSPSPAPGATPTAAVPSALRPRAHALALPGAASVSRQSIEGVSLQQRVEHLLMRGTPRDRYQAFAVLARCAHAIDFDRYLTSLPAGSETTRLRERYGDGSVRIAAACGDLSARLVERRIELVAAAADDGIPGAASAWIEEGPYGDRSALTQRPDDPLVVEWAEQAIARVLAATRHSDTDAIGQFGMLCLNWELDDVARVRLLVDSALQRRREDMLKAMLSG